MPITKVNNTIRCKANGVPTEKDPWKRLPEDMFKLNPNSDKPNKEKEQMIYIEQKANGLMIVDSDKLVLPIDEITMHEQAWMNKVLISFVLKRFDLFKGFIMFLFNK